MTCSKEDFKKLIQIEMSLALNLDQHLEIDHKEEVHGYIKETKQYATTRYYVRNCYKQLEELLQTVK